MPQTIPMADLRAQYRALKPEIDSAIARVLESGQFVLGAEVAAFEEAFAETCGARHCVAVNSGTSALHLALLAAGVREGDEVVTVPYSFVATVAAIRYAGARPVLVDVDPETFNLDPRLLERAIGPRTRAVLPVHLFGQPADMDPILEIARRRGIAVIEDAAQAHAAEYKGRRVGAVGDLGCFSFYPGKNLGAFGEGGAVVTNDDSHAKTLRLLRNWGMEQRYHHILRGYNYRMEGLQGAILGVKLNYLEQWTEARRAHAAAYNKLLAGIGGLRIPRALPFVRHVFHVYALRLANREAVRAALADAGIAAAVYYPIPLHLLEAHQDLGYRAGDFPVAERLCREELSLPIYPELAQDQLERIAAIVARSAVECAAAAPLPI